MKRSSEDLEELMVNTSQLSSQTFPQFNAAFKPKTSGNYGRSLYGYERIYIDHKHGRFVSSSGPESQFLKVAGKTAMRELHVYGLTVIRTRQMWPKFNDSAFAADGGKIAMKGKQCISLDGDIGHPLNDFPHTQFDVGLGKYLENDKSKALCETCPFTKWSQDGKHGPLCQPHWYIPIIPLDYVEKDYNMDEVPAILDLTQSGITSFKKFFSHNAKQRVLFYRPMAIKLGMVQKNDTRFSRPEFSSSRNAKFNGDLDRRKIYMTYWSRKISSEFKDEKNIPNMSGSKSSGFVALKPSSGV